MQRKNIYIEYKLYILFICIFPSLNILFNKARIKGDI